MFVTDVNVIFFFCNVNVLRKNPELDLWVFSTREPHVVDVSVVSSDFWLRVFIS